MADDRSREEQDERERKPASGPRITGRDFAGASFASDQDDQTADHRGESQRFRSDDTPRAQPDDASAPRDES